MSWSGAGKLTFVVTSCTFGAETRPFSDPGPAICVLAACVCDSPRRPDVRTASRHRPRGSRFRHARSCPPTAKGATRQATPLSMASPAHFDPGQAAVRTAPAISAKRARSSSGTRRAVEMRGRSISAMTRSSASAAFSKLSRSA